MFYSNKYKIVFLLMMFTIKVCFSVIQLKCENVEKNICNVRNLNWTNTDEKFSYEEINFPVKEINFKNCSFESIPIGILVNFRHLTKINISNCGLSEIGDGRFKDGIFYKLVHSLDLSHNKIKTIEKEIFYGAHVQHLNMSYNRITSIHDFAFYRQTYLRTVHLANNHIEMINPVIFHWSNVLEYIDLRNNNIKTGDNFPLFLDTIKTISISNNALTTFRLVPILFRLEELFIENNFLTTLSIGMSTKKINANHNHIKSLTIFHGLNKLVSLKLSHNNLTDIENFKNANLLEDLHLSFNNLTDIKPIKNLKKLKTLCLENSLNGLLDYKAFTELTQLEFLDISYNHLTEIDFLKLKSLKKLKTLIISGNYLEKIHLNLKEAFPSLTQIGISNTLINCTSLRKIFDYFDLNQITVMPDKFDGTFKIFINGVGCDHPGYIQEVGIGIFDNEFDMFESDEYILSEDDEEVPDEEIVKEKKKSNHIKSEGDYVPAINNKSGILGNLGKETANVEKRPGAAIFAIFGSGFFFAAAGFFVYYYFFRFKKTNHRSVSMTQIIDSEN